MKPVKSYQEFKAELNESRVNENRIGEFIKGAIEKIGEWFKGVGSKFLNAILIQQKGKLPAAVTIIPSKADIEFLKSQGKSVSRPNINALAENEEFEKDENIGPVNEGKIYSHAQAKTGIQDVDATKMKKLIAANIHGALTDEPGAPILFWGAPGIGKSAIVEQVASEFSFSAQDQRLIKVDLLTMNPEDLFLPYIKDKDVAGVTRSGRAPAEWLPVYHIKEGAKGNDIANSVIRDDKGNVIKEGGILFFDEVFRAKGPTRDALLTLLDAQRRIGDYKLGDKWIIVAAANREEDEPGQDVEQTFAFADRFTHYNYSPKFEDWEKWALVAKTKSGRQKIKPEILTFVKWFGAEEQAADQGSKVHGGGKYFYDMDTERKVNANPRAWEKASKILHDLETHLKTLSSSPDFKMQEEDIIDAVAGAVGVEPARHFASFLEMLRTTSIADLEKVYTDPEKAITLKEIKSKLESEGKKDITMQKIAFLVTLATLHAGKVLSEKELENLCIWLTRPENEEKRLITTFLTAFLDNAHPYLHPSYKDMSDDKKEELKKAGDQVDKKMEILNFFLKSPECKKMIQKYRSVLA